jgi:hypothetical protein
LEWKAYDPAWLVELARESRPDEPWLVKALSRCTLAAQESRAYTYFVDPSFADEPSSPWRFERTITLEHPREGALVLDVLQGRRIGGVEFLKRL